MNKRFIAILVLILLPSLTWPQKNYNNIFSFNYVKTKDKMHISNAMLLTGFNLNGYNNQPSFIDKNTVAITSNTIENDNTDIYFLDLISKSKTRFTETNHISEYSPTLSQDEQYLYTVRVEADGTTQSLWQYPIDRKNSGKRLLSSTDNIGYFTWLTNDKVAVFLVNKNENTLALFDIEENRKTELLSEVGRCLKTDHNGNLLFVHKLGENNFYLKRYDFTTKKISELIKIPVEDFEILDDGSIIMANGSKMFLYNENGDLNWNEVFDFSIYGLQHISRIAAKNNTLVLVN